MHASFVAVAIVALCATPGRALIPAPASEGFVSAVFDDGTELIKRKTHEVTFLPWSSERAAREIELEIAQAWVDLLTRIGQDWVASVASCWFCAPGGWPTLNVLCLEAARQAVRTRLVLTYQPSYWAQTEAALHRLSTVWWRGPRPGQGAVLACVAGEVMPPYGTLLPDPYFHQPPPPPYPPAKRSAEPPGDPEKEALKEVRLTGRPAPVEGYEQIGYVVFLRATGATLPRTFSALVTGTCFQCVPFWCWPVTRTWTVTLELSMERALLDWPAVAEGYGIPGVR